MSFSSQKRTSRCLESSSFSSFILRSSSASKFLLEFKRAFDSESRKSASKSDSRDIWPRSCACKGLGGLIMLFIFQPSTKKDILRQPSSKLLKQFRQVKFKIHMKNWGTDWLAVSCILIRKCTRQWKRAARDPTVRESEEHPDPNLVFGQVHKWSNQNETRPWCHYNSCVSHRKLRCLTLLLCAGQDDFSSRSSLRTQR